MGYHENVNHHAPASTTLHRKKVAESVVRAIGMVMSRQMIPPAYLH